MTQRLDGANTTAQWYQSKYPNAATFSRLEKFVIHTTETGGWPAYGGGASAPNATYHPKLRQIRQHFANTRSARALRDPENTAVRENRDNVFQLEIVCYSDKAKGDSVGGLWVGDLTLSHYQDIATICRQLNQELGLPLQSSVEWREGRTSAYAGVRLTSAEYDTYRGILGHVHVPGNTHWDPGGFRWSRLESALDTRPASSPGRTASTSKPSVSLSRLVTAAKTDPPSTSDNATYPSGTRRVEAALVDEGLLPKEHADASGHFGTKTVEAYAAWQRRCGYRGADADGIPGKESLQRLGSKYGFETTA